MSWFTAKNWSFTRKRKWLKVLSSKIAIISLDKIYFSPKFLQGWRLAPTTPFLSSVMYHGFILKVYIFFFFKKPNTVNFRHSVNRHPPPPLFFKIKMNNDNSNAHKLEWDNCGVILIKILVWRQEQKIFLLIKTQAALIVTRMILVIKN